MRGAAGWQAPQLRERSEKARETMGFVLRKRGSPAARDRGARWSALRVRALSQLHSESSQRLETHLGAAAKTKHKKYTKKMTLPAPALHRAVFSSLAAKAFRPRGGEPGSAPQKASPRPDVCSQRREVRSRRRALRRGERVSWWAFLRCLSLCPSSVLALRDRPRFTQSTN